MLNKRLQAIAEQVDDGSVLLDIGCDHALLDIFLVLHKENVHVIASDISAHALEQAKKNVQKYQVVNRVQLCQGDGLDVLIPGVNTIVISGMGGMNIIGILQNQESLKHIETLILSPNTDIPFVRSYLTTRGFYIVKEVLVMDRGKYYEILVLKKGSRIYSEQEILLGPYLLKENSPLFQRMLQETIKKKKSILPSLENEKREKRDAFLEELKLLESAYRKN